MTVDLDAWTALAEASHRFYAAGDGARGTAGERWFAALSGLDNAELNVCGLLPGATTQDVEALLDEVGPDLPAIVFVSEHAGAGVTDRMTGAGWEVTTATEPLMTCRAAPAVETLRRSAFDVRPATTADDLDTALSLMSQAHHVPEDLVRRCVRPAAADDAVRPWLARSDGTAMSVVWLVRCGSAVVVKEMMTPPRFQRRGAGRALLAGALAGSWDDGVDRAVLLSTVAGQGLYASVGFSTVDASVTAYRGIDDAVLTAIGQVPG